MQIIETVIQLLKDNIFPIFGGSSIIGISLFEFKYKIIRKKYAAYLNRKKSFADFSEDLETISRKLNNDGDAKEL